MSGPFGAQATLTSQPQTIHSNDKQQAVAESTDAASRCRRINCASYFILALTRNRLRSHLSHDRSARDLLRDELILSLTQAACVQANLIGCEHSMNQYCKLAHGGSEWGSVCANPSWFLQLELLSSGLPW